MELQLPISASELTRAEQKILDFINTNTDTFLFLSIGQLAKRLEISDATLSRFARHAGCRDFKALKTLVMEQASGPAVKIAGTLHREEHFSPVGFLQQQQLYLQKTAEQLDEATFDRAAQTIAQAKRILIYGKKASSSLAQLIYFRLRRLGLQVSLLPSGGSELLEGLGQIGEGDLVILFSFSKLSREGKILLEQGRKAGYQTLAFVSRTCLPPEESADIVCLSWDRKRVSFYGGTDCIAGCFGGSCDQTNGGRRRSSAQDIARAEKDVFFRFIKIAFFVYDEMDTIITMFLCLAM